ncbi:MAG: pyruvate kinase [Psychroflexus sp.]
MRHQKEKLQEILELINSAINQIYEFEKKYESQINQVHPNYTQSAKNLVHYLALRSIDLSGLQDKLDDIGLPVSLESKDDILHRMKSFRVIIYSLLGEDSPSDEKDFYTKKDAQSIIKQHSENLFGRVKSKRKTAIMVTQPTEAAENQLLVDSFLNQGMDCARVNCAHDNKVIWKQIIENIKNTDPECKITMDLAGLKIRTGQIKEGAKVIHIKPKKDMFGKVVAPARIWMAPQGEAPPHGKQVDAVISVNEEWLKKSEKGSKIVFKDARGKKRKIHIDGKENRGVWGVCKKSAFVTIKTVLNVFFDQKKISEIHSVHDLQSLEEIIFLFKGDQLRLDKKPIIGAPCVRDENGKVTEAAHISCTLPSSLDHVSIDDPIFFNDGKIGGIVNEIHPDFIMIEITQAKKKGGKLRSDKGINLPSTQIDFSGLTEKDKIDLRFVAENADVVNFSFVNNSENVTSLLNELKKLNSNIGIVLKIETMSGYRNLPSILLKAMQNYPVGVMIARGDLAIETGWKNFAIIQEEIMQICSAAQIPPIWATQVLENLTKKGIPTRAEITDAAIGQRAECVMLNKGPYLEQAIKMLDQILRKTERIHDKKKALLPKLEFNDDF